MVSKFQFIIRDHCQKVIGKKYLNHIRVVGVFRTQIVRSALLRPLREGLNKNIAKFGGIFNGWGGGLHMTKK